MTARAALLCPLLALLLVGCSERKVEVFGLRYEPPRGVSLVQMDSKATLQVAEFDKGLEIRSIPKPLPEVGPEQLEAILQQVRKDAGRRFPEGVRSRRAGSIPAGAIARYELADAQKSVLLYVLPRGDRYVVFALTNADGRLSNQFELSLGSLRAADAVPR